MAKRSILYFICLMAVSLNSCNDESAEPVTSEGLSADLVKNPHTMSGTVNDTMLGKLKFKDTIFNFGDIKAGSVVSHSFSFVNVGKGDIIINSAKGSCGCTVPEYPTHLIKPGDSGQIKVTFNSEGKHGFNDKNVAVFTNGFPSVYQLYIQAAVK